MNSIVQIWSYNYARIYIKRYNEMVIIHHVKDKKFIYVRYIPSDVGQFLLDIQDKIRSK